MRYKAEAESLVSEMSKALGLAVAAAAGATSQKNRATDLDDEFEYIFRVLSNHLLTISLRGDEVPARWRRDRGLVRI